jgi:YbgC/YbaW family acyl-CoA thioester hydrolase
MLPGEAVVPHVYTARVRVCHHELDAFGRVYPAAYLRHLAAIAVDASAAAGFDGAYYARHGVHWLVRRTTLELAAPATLGADLEISTWVEDFRRVRSQRRYAMRTAEGRPILDAITDWVLVESGTGKLRRVPDEMERAFGTAPARGASPRVAWSAPPAPPSPTRMPYAVRYTDLDFLMHVNNATYLDVLTHAGLDALARVDWSLDRLVAAGAVPLCVRTDIEYLDMARFGDPLEVETWLTPEAGELGVHQRLVRADDRRAIVRCTSAWRWNDPATHVPVPTPEGLASAVREARAA